MYENIKQYFEKNGISKFRFRQLEDAIFKNFVSDFDEITNFSKQLRDDLKKEFEISSMFLVESHKSNDAVKFVLKTYDNQFIESVLMIHKDGRKTVCVSSQIFCSVGCSFCATGANSFKRSLTTEEIIEQVLFICRYLKNENEKITNVVFMGMGEPFLNYDNVIESIKILNDKNKFNIGARHIVVSTSGIIPKIYEFADLKIQTKLAISLHAPNDKLRTKLMPINKKYPLKDLMKTCDNFTEKTNKKISYEYVLIKGVNDKIEYAKELVNLLKGKLAYVNLLVYNPHKFSDFEKPSREVVLKFRDFLKDNRIEVNIRRSMGDEINGACGQLSGKKC